MAYCLQEQQQPNRKTRASSLHQQLIQSQQSSDLHSKSSDITSTSPLSSSPRGIIVSDEEVCQHLDSCLCLESKENQATNHNHDPAKGMVVGSPARTSMIMMASSEYQRQESESFWKNLDTILQERDSHHHLSSLSPPSAPQTFNPDSQGMSHNSFHVLSSSLPNSSTSATMHAMSKETKISRTSGEELFNAYKDLSKNKKYAQQQPTSKNGDVTGVMSGNPVDKNAKSNEEDDIEENSSSSGENMDNNNDCNAGGTGSTNDLLPGLFGCSNPDSLISPEHKKIVDRLRSEGIIKSDRVYQAMLHVNFANFGWCWTYSDAENIAQELEHCANFITEKSKVLVINSWYYIYIPLCLALMTGNKGYVVGHCDEGHEFVEKEHSFVLDSHRLVLVKDYGWDDYQSHGYPLKARYDVILVHDKYFTPELKEQLKSTGIAFDQINNRVIFDGASNNRQLH